LSNQSPDVDTEQKYLDTLYQRLDDLREQAAARLRSVLAAGGPGGTLQARTERDAAAREYASQLNLWHLVEEGLCFGKLEFDEGEDRYIGRIGVFDDTDDYRPMLLDWRAPASRPFYLATAASPEGVRLRRHLRTRQRTVVGIDDEVLDVQSGALAGHDGLGEESVLLSALNAQRTGRMTDIVATIQAEQDRVIRSDLAGLLVVQGGPGTGKTAVALHRAAYLLYTYRRQLTSQGVLIVGPNQTFLRYISHVLPSLAETGVLLRTLGELYPGVVTRLVDSDAAARLKGQPVMADVLAKAVADRQQVPDEPVELVTSDEHAGLGYQREPIRLDPAVVAAARQRARASGRPHNLARPIFVDHVVGALARELVGRLGEDPYADDPLGGDDAPGAGALLLGTADVVVMQRELATDSDIAAALDRWWPRLTPQRVLADLYRDAERLATAAAQLSAGERAVLHRDSAGWSPADTPLLDELAELLGDNDQAAAARAAEIARRTRETYAEGVLDIARGSASIDLEDAIEEEILSVGDLLDAGQYAERFTESEQLTAAERAAADRRWTFGHIIVDEAQELSPMAWRVLMRRCPSRSMTVVGDVAQTSEPAGVTAWSEIFNGYLSHRWRQAELTVNYRTPAEVMAVVPGLLARIDPSLTPPQSVRSNGIRPWTRQVTDLPAGVAQVVTDELDRPGAGRIGVIVPQTLLTAAAAALRVVVPDLAIGEQPELEQPVVLLTVRQAKGLEFDSVVVVEPAELLTESPRGINDLYVALTRPTQRLAVLHHQPLPAELTHQPWA
jgi:DNA helicase IV